MPERPVPTEPPGSPRERALEDVLETLAGAIRRHRDRADFFEEKARRLELELERERARPSG